jgi:two-component system nitrogen regulation response regulator NtrX
VWDLALALKEQEAGGHMLVGASQVMTVLRERLERVARTDFTVLIEGESGAGKELAAREVHALSARARGPFVAVNCAAIVETLIETELFGIEERTATGVRGRCGKFEMAEDGTLFLDEVGDRSINAQAKLLRVLQDLSIEKVGGHTPHRVDTRIVAATNRSLTSLVREQRFRADLYYRLSGVEVHVPPLRMRRDDVPALVRHVLSRHDGSVPWHVGHAAMEALVAYDWPGNVRQLERVMERAVALGVGPEIGLDDLPADITQEFRDLTSGLGAGRDYTLRTWSRRYARLVLERCHGNRSAACTELGISYHTLKAYLDDPVGPPRERPGPRPLAGLSASGQQPCAIP